MISFRYHLVSATGFFLALAVGVIIGTTTLSGPVNRDLRSQVSALQSQRAGLAGQVAALQQKVAYGNQFSSHYSSRLVAGTLTNRTVLFIRLPAADSNIVDAITTQIVAAGAAVSGRVQLTGDYVDPAQANNIVNLVTSAHPPALTLPPTNDAGQLAAALLGFVLAGKGEPTDLTQVLSAFEQLHLLEVDGTVAHGGAVVVVGSGALPADDARGAAGFELVRALQRNGAHVVVAGDSATAAPGGIVALVRSQAASTVSTVDDADTAMGQVATVIATANAARSLVGQYGTGSGAQALAP